jgi:hypothetical protein
MSECTILSMIANILALMLSPPGYFVGVCFAAAASAVGWGAFPWEGNAPQNSGHEVNEVQSL